MGDNLIRASQKGIEVLKYVSENGASWVNLDNVDDSYRELFPDFIFLKLYDHFKNLIVNIGGIEINSRYEGDPYPPYKPLPGPLQRATLKYILEELDNLSWIDNPHLIKMSGMNSKFSTFFAANLISLVFQRIGNVAFAQNQREIGVEKFDPYTLEEMLNELTNFAFKEIEKGREPTAAQKRVLDQMVSVLLNNSSLPAVEKAKKKNPAAFRWEEPWMVNEIASFEPLTSIKYLVAEDNSPLYYKHILTIKERLERGIKKTKEERAQSPLLYLLQVIERSIGS